MDTLLYIQYILKKPILTILWSAMMCELQIFIMLFCLSLCMGHVYFAHC